jgi:threonine aldolase
MAKAKVGDDVFGDDPTVRRLEELVAGILGKEKGLYVPSGTMGNEICLKILTKPGDEVITEIGSHIYNNETGAAAAISGVQLHAVYGTRGVFTAEQVTGSIPSPDVHHPRASLVTIENTHTVAGGTVFPLGEIKRIKSVVNKHKMRMHLDGARLWNACVATGLKPPDYTKYFDTVTVCLSKGLGAPIGSVIASSAENIFEARRVRKMLGGGMRQVGIIAEAGIYAVKNHRKRITEDHENARWLAERLTGIAGIEIDLESVQTNLVVFDIGNSGLKVSDAVARLRKLGVWVVPFGGNRIRAVTNLNVDRKDLIRALSAFNTVFKSGR